MTAHKIDIEGVPEGWEVRETNVESQSSLNTINPKYPHYDPTIEYCAVHVRVILQKTKPRRIVLDEISRQEARVGDYVMSSYQVLSPVGARGFIDSDTFWRIKEE